MVSFILPGNSASGEYEVANSLRFDDGSSDSLSFTTGTPTNSKIFTFSTWLKKCKNGAEQDLMGYDPSGNAEAMIRFDDSDRFVIADRNSSDTTVDLFLVSNAQLRDPSAWYNLIVAVDTTQGTDSNRVKMYINGTEVTSFNTSTYPSQDYVPELSAGSRTVYVGARGSASFLDGYLAETVFIDGQQLDATSFGEFDEDSSIWKAKDVSGLTFGNNGFYLDFENSSSLGADVSGNGNNFTVNNLTSVDQSTDTCTINFATMNPLVFNTSTGNTFAEGNLQVTTTDSAVFGAVSSIGVSSGKWYMEVKPTQIQNKNAIGVTAQASEDARNNHRPGDGTHSAGIRSSGDAKLNGSSESGSWDSFTTSDIVGVALDLDNNKLYFSKNGTFMNSGNPTSGSTGTGAISLTDPASTTDGFYFFAFGDPGAGSGTANIAQFNFGSPPYSISSGNADANGYGNFEYSVPSGYYALNTKNLAEYG